MSKPEEIIEVVEEEIESRRFADMINGTRDSTAEPLKKELDAYKAGLNGTIPPNWEKFKYRLDPEWEEYQRLRSKFRGK